MAVLDTVPLRRSGQITAAEQREIVLDRTWAAANSVPTVIILGAVLALCPWLGPVMGFAGFVGAGMSVRRPVQLSMQCPPNNAKKSKPKPKRLALILLVSLIKAMSPPVNRHLK